MAQVKCSGEKTGCVRCQNLSLKCEYLESKMGKVPGIRARKNRVVHGSVSSMTVSDMPPTPQTTHRQQSDFAEEATQNTREQSILSWTADFEYSSNSELLDFVAPGDGYNNEHYKDSLGDPRSLTASGDISGPCFGFGMDDGPQAGGTTQQAPTHSNEPENYLVPPSHSFIPSPHSKPKSQVDSQCVLACIQIILSLENYILTDLRSEELILDVSRCTVEQLTILVDMQKDSRSVRCMALFSVVLHQLCELFEVGCSVILAECNGEDVGLHSVLPRKLKGFGGFGFGASVIDVEEQLAWKARKMAKELQLIIEVMRKISTLARTGPRFYTGRTAMDRDFCLDELMHRMNNLHSQLCSSGP